MRDGFGVVVKFSQGQPASQIDLLQQLGVSWVRDAVNWAEMEPRAGDYQPFPPAFLSRLKRYREAGIGVIFMLGYANAKAYPATASSPRAPIAPDALGRYGGHVTRLLQQAGVPFVIQVWNEPHNYQILKMVGGAWNGKPPSPWVDHYIEMLRAVSTEVHTVSPSTTVITSEDVLVNHYWFAQHPRLPKGFKGIGLHAYTNDSSPGPEVAAPYADSDWARPFQLVDKDRAFEAAIARLKRHTRRHTGVDPEVWITEWGFKLGSRHAGEVMTEDRVAAFLPRAYVLAEAAGVQALCWFSMHDAVDGPYGLIDRTGRQRPAFKAYAAMNRLIGAHTLSHRLSEQGRRTRGLQAYLFTQGPRKLIMVWQADNRPQPMPLDADWSVSSLSGVDGEPIEPAAHGKGKQVLVGAAPIYIELGETGQPTWPPRTGE